MYNLLISNRILQDPEELHRTIESNGLLPGYMLLPIPKEQIRVWGHVNKHAIRCQWFNNQINVTSNKIVAIKGVKTMTIAKVYRY